MHVPIRLRLTLISSALMGAVLVALGVFLYLRLEADLLEAVDDGLRTRADILLVDLNNGAALGADWPVEPDEAFAQVIAPGGDVLAGTAGFEDEPLIRPDVLALQAGFRYSEGQIPSGEGPIPVRLLATPTADRDLLVVGTSLEDQRDALARLLTLLVVGGPVAIGLASVVGWLVAGAALRPVERLRVEAEAVSGSEPGRRLVVPATGDELARLAHSLNQMLARLEEAMTRERRLVSDASHELRTPLANLKAELELALRKARSTDELTAALHSAADETDRLTRLSEDLLVLARTDQGRLPVRREDHDLGQLLQETVASFAGRAEGLGVALEASVLDGLHVDVDGARIRQAVGNLVDNGLRHTPAGGRVTVGASREAGTAIITVDDTGPGFPPDFLTRAFEPFSRSDVARSRTDGGAGLGLAIVRAVAEAHGGSADASNHPAGGGRVSLRIPVSRA
jgi:heavy metal sensor kinase